MTRYPVVLPFLHTATVRYHHTMLPTSAGIQTADGSIEPGTSEDET